MTIDPSAHHGDPIGEAFSCSSQKVDDLIHWATAWARACGDSVASSTNSAGQPHL